MKKFLLCLPRPTLHIFIDLGFFSVNTMTMNRDALRAVWVYQRFDITLFKWKFHLDIYDNYFHQHRYKCKEFNYRIEQMRLAMDRAGSTGSMTEMAKEVAFLRKLIEDAGKAFEV